MQTITAFGKECRGSNGTQKSLWVESGRKKGAVKTSALGSDVGAEAGVSRPPCKSNLGCFLGSDVESDDESSIPRPPRPSPSPPVPQNQGFLQHRLWQDMTTEDFKNFEDIENVVAILPVAAIEQHGPHLPVCTDACINEGVLRRALELLPQNVPTLVLPAMPIGKSNEHLAFPGTLSLSAATLTALWTDIGQSVAKAGVRKLVLFNSHGGQPQIMDIVARELRIRCNMFVVTLSWFSFGTPEGLFPKHEIRHGIHGGAVETSMMMHLRPDLVKHDKCRNFESLTSKMENEGYRRLQAEGGVGFGWQMQDLHESGAAGDATNADAERGEELVEFAAERLVELLGEVHRYPLSNIRSRDGVAEALELASSHNGRWRPNG
ncbi:creatinine amidohydrolase [Klebsormidium nitens]|uniref:Creatinine amidohydrolase n=1 Tax=Klebsormidium nitens TaxID=105231 RepID=A0A1Y1HXN3_KLENI|nr:creatinine amidohydrolase [Klebsormidium nitens]|eukprot:GAQ81711.1 creatinine amidohydrolase [Klebsormidium nitens]